MIAFELPFLNVRTQSKPCRGITTQKSIPKLTTETGPPRGPRPQFELKKIQKIRKSSRPAWKLRSRREIRPTKRIQARRTLQLKSQAKGDRRATKKVCRKNMLCCMLGCLGRCVIGPLHVTPLLVMIIGGMKGQTMAPRIKKPFDSFLI